MAVPAAASCAATDRSLDDSYRQPRCWWQAEDGEHLGGLRFNGMFSRGECSGLSRALKYMLVVRAAARSLLCSQFRESIGAANAYGMHHRPYIAAR